MHNMYNTYYSVSESWWGLISVCMWNKLEFSQTLNLTSVQTSAHHILTNLTHFECAILLYSLNTQQHNIQCALVFLSSSAGLFINGGEIKWWNSKNLHFSVLNTQFSFDSTFAGGALQYNIWIVMNADVKALCTYITVKKEENGPDKLLYCWVTAESSGSPKL